MNPSTQHPRLRGARLKLRRAHEHLVRIAEEARRVTDPESFRLTYHVEGEGVHHVWRIHELLTLDEMFSLWVGDCAHNLRSVLDHIAWELVSCSGQMPSTATHFPLKDVRPKQLSITPDPGTAAMNIVDQFQPYQSGGSHALLALLHLLDIIDKHRELVSNVPAVDVAYFGTPEGVRAKDAYAYGDALTQGAPFMHALVDPPQPNGGLTGHTTLAVKVAATVNWTPILDAPPIDIFLRDAANHLEFILSEFDRFFMEHDPPTAA